MLSPFATPFSVRSKKHTKLEAASLPAAQDVVRYGPFMAPSELGATAGCAPLCRSGCALLILRPLVPASFQRWSCLDLTLIKFLKGEQGSGGGVVEQGSFIMDHDQLLHVWRTCVASKLLVYMI